MPNLAAASADSNTEMTTSTPNPYLRTKVMTASPAELRLLLLDGAIKFLQQGMTGIENKDYEAVYNGISRCQNILMELLNGLDPEQEPDLCAKLSGLYTFMYTRLMKACTEKDAAIAEEVLNLLRYERETWTLLMRQMAEENASGAAAASDIAEEASTAAPPDGEGPAHTSDLIGGQVSLKG
jgi:flagellar protein FliS